MVDASKAPSSKGLIPAAAYIRMSSSKQEASPDQQRAEVAKLATRHGYKIVREFYDEAISGDDTPRRKGFQAMHHAACNGGGFKVILCWDQDRFGRFDPIEAGYWIKPLRDAGVKLLTVAQGLVDWNDFAGRMMYLIQQEAKHEFLRDLSRNVCRGLYQAASTGKLVGQLCFGYLNVEGRRVPDPDTAPIVRRVFGEYLEPGGSLLSITMGLNPDGIPAPGGGLWTAMAVLRILRRRKYTGTYLFGEQHKGKYHVISANGIVTRNRNDTERQSKEPIVHPNAHEGLVDCETFERVQAKLASQRTDRTPARGQRRYYFSGLLRCGHCGEAMRGSRARNQRRYECAGYHRHGKSFCSCNTVLERPLLVAVIDKIRREYLLPEKLEALKAEIRAQLEAASRPAEQADAERMHQRMKKLEGDIEKGTARLLTADDDVVDLLTERLRVLRCQRDELQARLEAVQKPQDAACCDPDTIVDLAAGKLWTLTETSLEADREAVHNLLVQAVSRVEVSFSHEKKPRRTYSTFRRAKVFMRPVIESSLLSPPPRCCGSGPGSRGSVGKPARIPHLRWGPRRQSWCWGFRCSLGSARRCAGPSSRRS